MKQISFILFFLLSLIWGCASPCNDCREILDKYIKNPDYVYKYDTNDFFSFKLDEYNIDQIDELNYLNCYFSLIKSKIQKKPAKYNCYYYPDSLSNYNIDSFDSLTYCFQISFTNEEYYEIYFTLDTTSNRYKISGYLVPGGLD